MPEPDFVGLFFFLIALVADCVLVFCDVYFLANFSDLETDNINPIDMCKHLNLFVLPEIIGHAVLTFFFIIIGPWWCFLLNLPLIAWNVYRIQNKKHLLDATQIFRDIKMETRVLFAKLGFYMICFCVYLFCLIRAAIGH